MIVASSGGSPTHPDWYYNLKVSPRITVEVGAQTFTVLAAELAGGAPRRAVAEAGLGVSHSWRTSGQDHAAVSGFRADPPGLSCGESRPLSGVAVSASVAVGNTIRRTDTGKIIISDNVSLDGVIQDLAGDEGLQPPPNNLRSDHGRPAYHIRLGGLPLASRDETLGAHAFTPRPLLLAGVKVRYVHADPTSGRPLYQASGRMTPHNRAALAWRIISPQTPLPG